MYYIKLAVYFYFQINSRFDAVSFDFFFKLFNIGSQVLQLSIFVSPWLGVLPLYHVYTCVRILFYLLLHFNVFCLLLWTHTIRVVIVFCLVVERRSVMVNSFEYINLYKTVFTMFKKSMIREWMTGAGEWYERRVWKTNLLKTLLITVCV